VDLLLATLAGVDLEWAREKVQGLLYDLSMDRAGFVANYDRKPWQLRINKALPLVERIAMATKFTDTVSMWRQRTRGWEWEAVQASAQQLLGYIETLEELDVKLAPDGPHLEADRLHEWVWSSAALLWSDGHRREAVQTAATKVDVQARAKVGRADISGADLMMQAFAVDKVKVPTPRFRFPGLEPGTETYKSAHDGAKFFGAGCMLGIRNLATHSVDQPDEQVALEHLAALSVLARWVEECDVVVQEPEA
jgi:hypothetical protein